jgi:hypothetical protein
VAPAVASLSVTDCGVLYVPPGGLSVGVATRIVYVALATLLSAIPLAAAIALIVMDRVTEIGAVYGVDAVVGVLPSVV